MNLALLRTQLGLTQEELAEELGYTSRQVQRWEAGAAKVPKLVQLWVQHRSQNRRSAIHLNRTQGEKK